MRIDVRAETRLGPGPYSVYVDGQYLTTMDTLAEVEEIKAEQCSKVTAGDAKR